MENLTSITITGKKTGSVWRFKYDFDGSLRGFEVLEGAFTNRQADWLFKGGRFPYNLSIIDIWVKNWGKEFEIEKNLPVYDFDTFWNNYGKKVGKKETFDFWKKKMKEAQHIKSIKRLTRYKDYCKINNRPMKDPIRYLRHEIYNDEF